MMDKEIIQNLFIIAGPLFIFLWALIARYQHFKRSGKSFKCYCNRHKWKYEYNENGWATSRICKECFDAYYLNGMNRADWDWFQEKPSVDQIMEILRTKGCNPSYYERAPGQWRFHVNVAGNYWVDDNTPVDAALRAVVIWRNAGCPIEG